MKKQQKNYRLKKDKKINPGALLDDLDKRITRIEHELDLYEKMKKRGKYNQ
jgi:hypothetical protein